MDQMHRQAIESLKVKETYSDFNRLYNIANGGDTDVDHFYVEELGDLRRALDTKTGWFVTIGSDNFFEVGSLCIKEATSNSATAVGQSALKVWS